MKSVYIYLILTIFICSFLDRIYCQNLDFILVIDDKIAQASTANMKLELFKSSGEVASIPINYHPGNLSLGDKNINEITSTQVDSIILKFTYYEYIGQKQNIYHYVVNMKKPWLKDQYLILRLYNLNKKKFRKRFRFIEDEEYVYEIDSTCCTYRLVKDER